MDPEPSLLGRERELAALVELLDRHRIVTVNTGSGQVSLKEALDQIPSTVDLHMVRAVFETNVFG